MRLAADRATRVPFKPVSIDHAPRNSVVIRAAQVIAALRADQLAVVAGEPVTAGGAYLAIVLDRLCAGAGRLTR